MNLILNRLVAWTCLVSLVSPSFAQAGIGDVFFKKFNHEAIEWGENEWGNEAGCGRETATAQSAITPSGELYCPPPTAPDLDKAAKLSSEVQDLQSRIPAGPNDALETEEDRYEALIDKYRIPFVEVYTLNSEARELQKQANFRMNKEQLAKYEELQQKVREKGRQNPLLVERKTLQLMVDLAKNGVKASDLSKGYNHELRKFLEAHVDKVHKDDPVVKNKGQRVAERGDRNDNAELAFAKVALPQLTEMMQAGHDQTTKLIEQMDVEPTKRDSVSYAKIEKLSRDIVQLGRIEAILKQAKNDQNVLGGVTCYDQKCRDGKIEKAKKGKELEAQFTELKKMVLQSSPVLAHNGVQEYVKNPPNGDGLNMDPNDARLLKRLKTALKDQKDTLAKKSSQLKGLTPEKALEDVNVVHQMLLMDIASQPEYGVLKATQCRLQGRVKTHNRLVDRKQNVFYGALFAGSLLLGVGEARIAASAGQRALTGLARLGRASMLLAPEVAGVLGDKAIFDRLRDQCSALTTMGTLGVQKTYEDKDMRDAVNECYDMLSSQVTWGTLGAMAGFGMGAASVRVMQKAAQEKAAKSAGRLAEHLEALKKKGMKVETLAASDLNKLKALGVEAAQDGRQVANLTADVLPPSFSRNVDVWKVPAADEVAKEQGLLRELADAQSNKLNPEPVRAKEAAKVNDKIKAKLIERDVEIGTFATKEFPDEAAEALQSVHVLEKLGCSRTLIMTYFAKAKSSCMNPNAAGGNTWIDDLVEQCKRGKRG